MTSSRNIFSHFVNSPLVGDNGVKISHIVLKAWFLVWGSLRPMTKVWFWAPAKCITLTSQWRHNDVKFSYNDVIMTSHNVIFAGAQNQNLLLGFRNPHTKFHAFSTMCEILLIFYTITLHYSKGRFLTNCRDFLLL